MSYMLLAWRNLWRNRKRTLITIASIFFGVLLASVMSSLQEGTYMNQVDMMVKLSTGYLQVRHPEFRETRSVNNAFSPGRDMLNGLEQLDNVTAVVQKLESFALLSSGPDSRPGAVIGIEPGKDRETSNLANWISDGDFLNKGDDGVLVTLNVARQLGLNVNDTIILISQGYRGVTAAGIFPVRGILTFSTPQMNSIGVYMDINAAMDFYAAEDMVTSLMIMVDGYTDVPAVKEQVEKMAEGLEVADWQELNPELVQLVETSQVSYGIMKFILYLVIGFGILATIIMMVSERKRELGVMVAVGMQKYRLGIVLVVEIFLIGLAGVITGFIVSIPLVAYLVNNPFGLPAEMADTYLQYGFEPYLFFSASHGVFINQVITVFIITMIISLYPVMKVKNLVVARSLRT